MEFSRQIIREIKSGKIKTRDELTKRKRILSKDLGKIPSNSEIWMSSGYDEELRKILQIKPTRTISGVAIIAVMSKPSPCPHGKCTYCPHFENVPESYTGKEPAARRGISNKFNPYSQVQNRLKQLYDVGHIPEKCELIIMGGTFPSLSKIYQKNFVKNCILAMNKFPAKKSKIKVSLETVQKNNEKSKIRCVGMTFETRPDYCGENEIDLMLKLGGTRVELGVQTIYNEIYEKTKRGHKIKDVKNATKKLKDAGFKVTYHLMPGLPGSSTEKDLKMFRQIFSNPDFMPDSLKIYPCLVIPGSELYEDWKKDKYKPLNEKEIIELMINVKKICPKFIRIMRIERDIPGTEIAAGIKSTNLRQIIQNEMKKRNLKCKCIRCREVGHVKSSKKIKVSEKDIKIMREEYLSSEGKEVFLSVEDIKNNVLLGILRLRKPSKNSRIKNSSIVRELHIYGEQTQIGKEGKVQHRGYGKRLLEEAEKITKKEWKLNKITVISGIGVREYYKKLSYKKDGVYVSKILNE